MNIMYIYICFMVGLIFMAVNTQMGIPIQPLRRPFLDPSRGCHIPLSVEAIAIEIMGFPMRNEDFPYDIM